MDETWYGGAVREPEGKGGAGAARALVFDVAFVVAAVAVTAWNDLASGPASVLAKLVPMGLLIARLARALRAKKVDPAMGGWVLAGFVASTAGDVVIAYRFVGGIAAFLVAHLCYLAAMGRPRGPMPRHALAALPVLVIGGGIAWVLVGGRRVPDPLLVPVIFYMTVISAMLARATGRALVDVRTPASRLLLAGAATFYASDMLIALSRWVVAIPHPRIAILATYYAAQRLLLAGVEVARPRE
jgi:alkylglycerol monooxygenase